MLKSWDAKNLSWFERISLIKSMVFPKYLFLFRTAPLDITASMLHSWQRTLLNFIWSYKKPRLSLHLLSASKLKGGQALPHLLYYYEAAVLSTLLKHYNTNYTADWKDIEDDAFLHKSFQLALWAPRKTGYYCYTPSPLCQVTLRVWNRNQQLLVSSDSPLRSFLGQPCFFPGKDPSAFQIWKHNGLTKFIDIAPKGECGLQAGGGLSAKRVSVLQSRI